MTDMATAFAAAVAAPTPPGTTWGLVDALGGRRAGTRQLANLKMGRDVDAAPPSSSTDAEEFKRYRAARRDVERWLEYERPTGKQKRRPPEGWLREQRAAVRAVATRRRIAELRRRGMRARVSALVRVSTDVRDRDLPSGGPGLLLRKPDTEFITAPFLAGDFARAGARFADRFLIRYGQGEEIGFEIVDVHRVKVWPDGTEEPR